MHCAIIVYYCFLMVYYCSALNAVLDFFFNFIFFWVMVSIFKDMLAYFMFYSMIPLRLTQ